MCFMLWLPQIWGLEYSAASSVPALHKPAWVWSPDQTVQDPPIPCMIPSRNKSWAIPGMNPTQQNEQYLAMDWFYYLNFHIMLF